MSPLKKTACEFIHYKQAPKSVGFALAHDNREHFILQDKKYGSYWRFLPTHLRATSESGHVSIWWQHYSHCCCPSSISSVLTKTVNTLPAVREKKPTAVQLNGGRNAQHFSLNSLCLTGIQYTDLLNLPADFGAVFDNVCNIVFCIPLLSPHLFGFSVQNLRDLPTKWHDGWLVMQWCAKINNQSLTVETSNDAFVSVKHDRCRWCVCVCVCVCLSVICVCYDIHIS